MRIKDRAHNKYKNSAIVMVALAMQTQSTAQSVAHTITFDTDAQPIGVDNRCTACISHRIEDFTGPLMDTNRKIKGFGGTRTSNLKVGTLKLKWEDDVGATHKFLIPNSYYAPSGGGQTLDPTTLGYNTKGYQPNFGY